LYQISLLQTLFITFSFTMWFIEVAINKTIDSLIPKSNFYYYHLACFLKTQLVL